MTTRKHRGERDATPDGYESVVLYLPNDTFKFWDGLIDQLGVQFNLLLQIAMDSLETEFGRVSKIASDEKDPMIFHRYLTQRLRDIGVQVDEINIEDTDMGTKH